MTIAIKIKSEGEAKVLGTPTMVSGTYFLVIETCIDGKLSYWRLILEIVLNLELIPS